MPRSSRAWVALMLATATSATASAQAIEPRVEALVREGIAHRIAGHDEAAIAPLEAAYAAQRTPLTAGQLALAYQAVGRWVDADRHLREALASPDDDWVRRHRAELDGALAVVRQNVGDLELRDGPDGATVSVDGVSRGALPLREPLRLRAGVATLELRAEGYFPLTRRVTILGGELTREPVAMSPLPREAPAPTAVATPSPAVAATVLRAPSRPPPPPRSRAVAWVLGGVGAAFLVGGATALVVREASATRFNETCPRLDEVPRDAQSGDCRAELSTGDWSTAAAVVGFAGGAVLMGVGVVLAVARRSDADAGAGVSWRCAPGLASVGCAVTF
ncbi:MAG: PEGA domain-containing protein [Polyangiales bacterium]